MKSCFQDYCLIMDLWKSTLMNKNNDSFLLGMFIQPWKQLQCLDYNLLNGSDPWAIGNNYENQAEQRTLAP
jgi:hypothetical protein